MKRKPENAPQRYMTMEKQLADWRALHPEDTPEEDAMLHEMDVLWWALSEEEIAVINQRSVLEATGSFHNACRSYCIEKEAHWTSAYDALCARGGDRVARARGGWDYTPAAYALFPRYNVLNAILVEVERLVPADFATLEEARTLLGAAGSAESDFTRSSSSIAIDAMNEERSSFVDFVRTSTHEEWKTKAALPFRRVLSPAATEEHFAKFEAAWGAWLGGHCKAEKRRTLTLHTDWVAALPQKEASIRALLRAQGITQILTLFEIGQSYELALDAERFIYGSGGEGYRCDASLDWMIYISHEATITFGGAALIAAVRALVPDIEAYLL